MAGRAPLPFLVFPTKNIRFLEIDCFDTSVYTTKLVYQDKSTQKIFWPTSGSMWYLGNYISDNWKEETEDIISNLIKTVGNSGKPKSNFDFSINIRTK